MFSAGSSPNDQNINEVVDGAQWNVKKSQDSVKILKALF